MEQTPNARRLSDVDRNFAAQTLRTPLRWMNITAASPLLRGLISDGGTPFCRLPRAVAEAVKVKQEFTSFFVATYISKFITYNHVIPLEPDFELSKTFL